jgi:hypothetical protein
MIFLKTKKDKKKHPEDEATRVVQTKVSTGQGRQSSVGGKQLAVSTKAKLRLQTAN